ncbi:MAG TPA: hypothetical protein VGP37_07465, partial [Candidatus Nanopelagicales bacterium]|nr:hypothetical protein [Candidatus Nanopelagicales bacterium]
RLARLRAAITAPNAPSAQPTVDRMREVLADDLRAPAALDALDDWARRALDSGPGVSEIGPPGSDAGALINDAADALLGVRIHPGNSL